MVKNYLYWCWKLKRICPWDVAYVSNRELTQEEYEYAKNIDISNIIQVVEFI